jgi:hypothetical protein
LLLIKEKRQEIFNPEYLKELIKLPILRTANDFMHGKLSSKIKNKKIMANLSNQLTKIINEVMKSQEKKVSKLKTNADALKSNSQNKKLDEPRSKLFISNIKSKRL